MEPLAQGLDRSAHSVYHNADRHLINPLQHVKSNQHSSSGSSEHGDEGSKSNSGSKLRRITKRLSGNVKTKADIIFHPTHHKKEKSADSTTAPTLAPPPTDEAENDRLYHDAPEQGRPTFKETIKHPVSTVQSALHGASGAKFADALDNQVIAHGAEVRLVRAYDEFVDAQSQKGKVKAADNLEELKKVRQDSFVRWTMDRHVLTVRRVPPRTIPWPNVGEFRVKNQLGKTRTQWADYGHHVGNHLKILCPYTSHSGLHTLEEHFLLGSVS